MVTHTTGLKLSERFYTTLVEPILLRECPSLPLAAARIGLGSEVLGYDTDMSADHDFGPSLQIFLTDAAFSVVAEKMMAALNEALPDSFDGWPIRVPANVRPDGAEQMHGMLWAGHGVELYKVDAWSERYLQRRCDTFPDATLRGRPFRLIASGAIADGLRNAIEDDDLRSRLPIGAADQFIGATFVRSMPQLCRAATEALHGKTDHSERIR